MSVLIATPSPVAYRVLDQAHLDECISIMTEIFAKGEPLTKMLGITLGEFEYFAELFARKAVDENLAVYAKDRVTGNMLAFCLSEDLVTEAPAGVEGISPKFGAIMALVEALDEWFAEKHVVEKGKYLHIFMTGVSRRCRHRHVSLGVVSENLRVAQDKGFLGALGESTTTLAARAAGKNGFKEYYAVKYDEFRYQGEAVFAEMGPRAKCRLMVKMFGDDAKTLTRN